MPQIESSFSQASSFALHSKMFRLFITGSFVSRAGDWMDYVALNWAILQLTDSPIYLGVINACMLIPTFLASLPAGILADRYDRRKLLMGIQAGVMLFTFMLAFLIEWGPSFWVVAAFVTMRSVLTAMDPPIRNGFIPLGAIFIGAIGSVSGAFMAGFVMGIGCIAVTLVVLLWRKQIWHL